MDIYIQSLGWYLLAGIIALLVLDIATGRIRNRIKDASYDSMHKMQDNGQPVGYKTALWATIIALWAFWPVAIFGAIISLFGKRKDGNGKE